MSVEMDETFTAALRELLVEHVQRSSTSRSWWRWSRRWSVTAAVVAALLAGGGGIAAATGAFSSGVPGSQAISYLAAPVTVNGDGTETVQLGAPPTGANAIYMQFSCLTAGNFWFGDGGAGASCSSPADDSDPSFGTLPLKPDQDSITIGAGPGQRWRLTATYVTATTTPWKVNASGQTYGTPNQNGTPDLIAVIATNHREGYAYANQIQGPQPTTPAQAATWAQTHPGPRTITVYKSNGKTPIGIFTADEGNGTATTIPPATATTPTGVSPTETTTTTPPATATTPTGVSPTETNVSRPHAMSGSTTTVEGSGPRQSFRSRAAPLAKNDGGR